jgi:hypothetical protein
MSITHELVAEGLTLPAVALGEPALKVTHRGIMRALRRHAALPFEEFAADDAAVARALMRAAAAAMASGSPESTAGELFDYAATHGDEAAAREFGIKVASVERARRRYKSK